MAPTRTELEQARNRLRELHGRPIAESLGGEVAALLDALLAQEPVALTYEQQRAAFDDFAAKHKNTLFTGTVTAHAAPFYFVIFQAGMRAAALPIVEDQ